MKVKYKGLKNRSVQVTIDGKKHPTGGVVASISWDNLMGLLNRQLENKRDSILSLRMKAGGVDVYVNTDDPSARDMFRRYI